MTRQIEKTSMSKFFLFLVRRSLRMNVNCHKCMINASCRLHSLTAAARYKFIPFKFSAARAVRGCLRGVRGSRGAPPWAGRSTITQVTKIDGKWADIACPRRHQLPRPDGHRRAVSTTSPTDAHT